MTRHLIVCGCGVFLLFCGVGLKVTAQNSGCSVSVAPRSEQGQTLYEIGGDGFVPGQELRIEATNQRTNRGYIFLVTPSTTNLSGVLIGKDPDGFYYRVSPGIWRVIVRADTCTAKTKFAVSGVPNGVWGGENEALVTSNNGARFLKHCQEGFIEEPLAPNAEGRFDVVGRYRVEGPGPDQGLQYTARFQGKVDGDSISLTITLTDLGTTAFDGTLTLGKTVRIFPCT